VCLPRYDTKRALALIAAEKVTNLYLVPTLYHDLVHTREFASADVSSVRKLGFAGASMTDGLLKKLNESFHPDLFVNHYGSSEIYTFTIDQNAPAKPGSAGKAGINQEIRVVKLNAASALLASSRRRREGPARRMVFYRRYRFRRSRRRSFCYRPRRRHDHHRRRKCFAGRD
jgi:acyl-coenzyme A synthetase/AMP-(fatty) acid ligase